jgi:hypothetical protein
MRFLQKTKDRNIIQYITPGTITQRIINKHTIEINEYLCLLYHYSQYPNHDISLSMYQQMNG